MAKAGIKAFDQIQLTLFKIKFCDFLLMKFK
jgi:hypothetical protein